MQFEVFTLLPEVFPPYLDSSILQRARQRGLIDVRVHNIRDYTHDRHHTADKIRRPASVRRYSLRGRRRDGDETRAGL